MATANKGRQSADPGWEGFQRLLKREMAKNDLSNADVADAINLASDSTDQLVDAKTVGNWRRGAARPRFAQLPLIARALQLPDPLDVARALGMIEDSPDSNQVVSMAFKVQRLQRQMAKSQQRRTVLRAATGAGEIVNRACDLGTWAVGVWPVEEGPRSCRLRVADRLDFKTSDGRPFDERELWKDLKVEIRMAGAIPGPASPRWTSGQKVEPGQRWSIPLIGAPRPSFASDSPSRLASVAVVSTTVASWSNSFAALLALALGFGFVSTRDLAMEIEGSRRGKRNEATRFQVHQSLLQAPQTNMVWSHYSQPFSTGLIPASLGRKHALIWVYESDEVLEFYTGRPECAYSLEDLKRFRDATSEQVSRLAQSRQFQPDSSGLVLTVETKHISEPEGDCSIRDRKWGRALEQTAFVLRQLRAEGLIAQSDLKFRQRDPAGGELYDWLASELAVPTA